MKKCPQCSRDYDNTMMFCLDDGAELLYGPASMDEPATAILHSTAAPGDEATRAQIHTTEQTAVLPSGIGEAPKRGLDKRLFAASIILTIIILAGFFGYRYFASASKQIESIAVMPFVNEGGNGDVEYLSDGMTETLINSLSQLPNIKVMSRSSVFRYKGTETDPKKVGTELGVGAVLTGRVKQIGDQLIINVSLDDARDSHHIWGEQYARKQTDLLSLQSELARDVSGKLKSKLSGADVAKVQKNYTANPEAYQIYLKGLFEYNKTTGSSLKQSAELYKKAIEIDPNYAEAYAALAMAYLNFANYSVTPPKESMPLAKAAALKALALDDSLGAGYVVLARYRSEFEWDRAGGETATRRAIELDPNNPRPHALLSQLLAQQKKFDESIAEATRTQQLDPLSLARRLYLSERLTEARRYDEGISNIRSIILLDQNFATAHFDLGWAYFGKGMYQESIASFERAFELDPDPVDKGYIAIAQAKLGQREESLKQLEWLKQEASKRYVPSIAFAFTYIALVQKDEAFAWLEKNAEDRTIYASSYAIEPALDDVRDDPRFKAMLKRMNLPE